MGEVTIKEVAKAAGVSMKSVSRVVNREANVSARLVMRVQAAIDRLGYVPHLAARSLAAGRSLTIGVLLDNPSPYYTLKIQEGAYRACREHGYHLLIEQADCGSKDLSFLMNDILRNARVDGFILTPPLTDCVPVLESLEARAIPYVRVAPMRFPQRSPAIAIDDRQAAHAVADRLWSLGHRRFGLVNGPKEHGAAINRRAGFLAALASHGCTSIAESYGGFEFEGGIRAGLELMRRKRPPTCIFGANDDSAAGVMTALMQLGLRVPQRVSVVGFDDSWIARAVWPYLTTIRQPIAEMAHAAATLLIRSHNKTLPLATTMLPFEFIERDSIGKPQRT